MEWSIGQEIIDLEPDESDLDYDGLPKFKKNAKNKFLYPYLAFFAMEVRGWAPSSKNLLPVMQT